jgi:hypothetical protein
MKGGPRSGFDASSGSALTMSIAHPELVEGSS